jgi:hypothetical protein
VIANTFYGAGKGRYIGALALIQSLMATGRFLPFIPGLVSVDLNLSSRRVSSSTPTTAVRTSSATSTFWLPARRLPQKCDGLSGFTCVGFGFPGSANSNNKSFQEGTVGFTQTIGGSPNHGKLQFINQSSWAERTPGPSRGRPEKRTRICGIYRSSLRSSLAVHRKGLNRKVE